MAKWFPFDKIRNESFKSSDAICFELGELFQIHETTKKWLLTIWRRAEKLVTSCVHWKANGLKSSICVQCVQSKTWHSSHLFAVFLFFCTFFLDSAGKALMGCFIRGQSIQAGLIIYCELNKKCKPSTRQTLVISCFCHTSQSQTYVSCYASFQNESTFLFSERVESKSVDDTVILSLSKHISVIQPNEP